MIPLKINNFNHMKTYKPDNYNSVSPYLIVDNAQQLVELLTIIFDAQTLRRFEREDGKIAHLELRLDDTVIMLCDSTDYYKANTTMLHVYVPDVFRTFDKAIENGCELIEKPVKQQGEPDIRGSFFDIAGNYWSVSTQD